MSEPGGWLVGGILLGVLLTFLGDYIQAESRCRDFCTQNGVKYADVRSIEKGCMCHE